MSSLGRDREWWIILQEQTIHSVSYMPKWTVQALTQSIKLRNWPQKESYVKLVLDLIRQALLSSEQYGIARAFQPYSLYSRRLEEEKLSRELLQVMKLFASQYIMRYKVLRRLFQEKSKAHKTDDEFEVQRSQNKDGRTLEKKKFFWFPKSRPRQAWKLKRQYIYSESQMRHSISHVIWNR